MRGERKDKDENEKHFKDRILIIIE